MLSSVTSFMTPFVAKLAWWVGVVGWFVIRYPHQRRSRKTPITSRRELMRERVLLSISFTGLFIVPATYAITGEPRLADYPFHPVVALVGTVVFALSLLLFYRTHRDLGRFWSVTLEIRQSHRLITTGVYRHVRHPMYSAFFLWAIAQALLLPNWIAGPAGLVGFGTLFAFRVGREERMMEATFGEAYRAYAARTRRVVPGVF
jgi:protein-S-isoprenylcysteine O-methyltransferase Ste14